jgi:Eco29kI restriction endonuclease
MATKKAPSILPTLIEELHVVTERILSTQTGSTSSSIKKARQALDEAGKKIADAAAGLDPIIRPKSVFDPTQPATAGRIVALTLVAQQRYPLALVPQFYGAGIYAIYFKGGAGTFSPYYPLSGTDHPIYIGKVDPLDSSAKDAVGQGAKLAARLREHARTIEKVNTTLNIDDFECRFLIVQTGFQKPAEDYLIRFFKPLWNSEIGICYGMSKHGDDAATRGNGRSPWHTLHPGIKWADNELLTDQKPASQIEKEIADHLDTITIYKDIHHIFDRFVAEMRQFPLPLADERVSINDTDDLVALDELIVE